MYLKGDTHDICILEQLVYMKIYRVNQVKYTESVVVFSLLRGSYWFLSHDI